MDIGVNVFSIRKPLIQGQIGVWSSLRKLGFRHVELMMTEDAIHPDISKMSAEQVIWLEQFRKFVPPFSESGSLVREIRGHGMNIDCVHVALTKEDVANLDHLSQKLIGFSKGSQIRNFVIGIDQYLDQIRDICPAIDRMASALKRENLQLIYHNHHMEWGKFADSTYLEFLLTRCPDLKMEADVGWMHYAHVDILPFLSRYADRLAYLHLKDLVVEHGKITFTPIGYGDVPMELILDYVQKHGFHNQLILDQDDSLDIMADLQKGIHFIHKKMGHLERT